MRQAKAMNTWIWKLNLFKIAKEMLTADPVIGLEKDFSNIVEAWWCPKYMVIGVRRQ